MNAVIFIPGYKASKLKNSKSDQTIFLEFKHLFSHHPLEYDISGKNNDIVHSGIFDEFVLPFVKVNVCKQFLKEIGNIGKNYELINFDYDWRIDILDHVKKLDMFIKKIEENYQNIYFIAHSLGGYFLCYYLKYGIQEPEKAKEGWYAPDNLNKIIFIAVPFKGIQVIFKDLHYNDGLLWNKKIFHKNVSRTYPAAYQLLPQYPNSVLDENGAAIDLFDLQNWKEKHFSFWENESINQGILEKYENFLKVQLLKSKYIADKISNSKQTVPDHCKVLNLIGTGTATPAQYIWDHRKNKLIIKNEKDNKDGDGLVLSETAELPEAYKNQKTLELHEKSKHAGFFKNKDIIDKMITFLKE